GAGNDIAFSVRIHVTDSDINTAGEGRIIREEFTDQLAGDAVENADMWPTAGTRRGDNIRDAVAVHVADRDADTAAEGRIVCQEIKLLRARGEVENSDTRGEPGISPDGDVPRHGGTREVRLRD